MSGTPFVTTPSALYETTGMPASIAFLTGVVNDVALITVVAMPLALAEIAVLKYVTISVALEVVNPPNFGAGRSSSAAASFMPFWVGTKNRFVVTWLTNQNSHAGVFGKFPAVAFAVLVPPLAVVPDEPHAASSAEAAAVALTSPVPLSSFRRVGPSFMLRVSIASSTFGSTLSIWASIISLGRVCPLAAGRAECPPGWVAANRGRGPCPQEHPGGRARLCRHGHLVGSCHDPCPPGSCLRPLHLRSGSRQRPIGRSDVSAHIYAAISLTRP